MVHALSESWRILKAGGRLIDLRPYRSEWYVELISKDNPILAGKFIGKEEGLTDDDMSDKAISEVIRRGLFKKENKEFFDYSYYWDSFDQMFDYVSTTWSNLVSTPKNVLSNVRQMEKVQRGQAVIRIRRKILIASYRKVFIKDGILK